MLRTRNNADPDLTFYVDADPYVDKTAKYSSDFMINRNILSWFHWFQGGSGSPSQALPSLKVEFSHEKCKVLNVGTGNKPYKNTNVGTKAFLSGCYSG